MSQDNLPELAKLVRYFILKATTEAESGHPTSSLSATDLMTALYFKYLRYDAAHHQAPNNDRVIFSKGHAAPLFYALCTAAGWINEAELLTLRKMGSPLQGHPTPLFPLSEAATGSLGQGLSIGLGMALQARRTGMNCRTYVLMGDGEMAEGQVWEAIQIAAHERLNNLIGIIDVNRLGQSQETMYGHNVEAYATRVRGFGWETIVIDGHSLPEIERAFAAALKIADRPVMLVAKTFKGKGISFLENKDGWHGKALSRADLAKALQELGPVDAQATGVVALPEPQQPKAVNLQPLPAPRYELGSVVATRKAYGEVLASLVSRYPEIIALDAEVKNSTFAEFVAKNYPDNYAEMFIAEQNMVGVAVGLARRGRVPFISSFAAFLTRAFDQFRMAAVSQANIRCAGSHVGVSIGEDGPSQMGLEDIAMFRAIHGSTVLYPADAVATAALVETMVHTSGVVYLRTSRPATPVIYGAGEKFPIGGSKVVRSSAQDKLTLVAAGVTLYEALKAHDILQKDGIVVRVIDAYSVKPIDESTLKKAATETQALIVVEDHWFEGGLGDAVLNALATHKTAPVYKMAVTTMSSSGKPEELMEAAGITAAAIVKKVKGIL